MRKRKFDKMIRSNKEQLDSYWEEILSPLKTNKILLKEETLIDARYATAQKTDGTKTSGILLITDIRIIFILGPENEEDKEKPRDFIAVKNSLIEEFVIKRNINKKDEAEVIIFYDELVFLFESVMIFGLQRWIEIIRESKKNVDS